jgi:hypothetical protein
MLKHAVVSELRMFFMTQKNSSSSSQSPGQLSSFNDAPIDMLSFHFMGRNKELEILEKNLTDTHANVPARCAIHGMAGLGKTQLALAYTKIFFDTHQDALVFWIPASSIEKINQGFSKILNLVAHPDRRHPEQSARQTATRRWLEELKISGPVQWLLVFDDANIKTLEFLREHLPRHGGHGQILFTTRTEGVAEALCKAGGQEHPTLDLKAPDILDATKLFLDSTEMYEDHEPPFVRSKVMELVKCLGCLPLAVSQAGSFMKQSHQTVDDILDYCRHGVNNQVGNPFFYLS